MFDSKTHVFKWGWTRSLASVVEVFRHASRCILTPLIRRSRSSNLFLSRMYFVCSRKQGYFDIWSKNSHLQTSLRVWTRSLASVVEVFRHASRCILTPLIRRSRPSNLFWSRMYYLCSRKQGYFDIWSKNSHLQTSLRVWTRSLASVVEAVRLDSRCILTPLIRRSRPSNLYWSRIYCLCSRK